MADNYNILIKKLDYFIRKYYKNQLVKGLIYSLGLLLAFFLLVNLLEHFGHFATVVRTILFYSYLFLNLVVILNFIVIPGLKWLKIGKIISHKQAASIIGEFFPEINDKLSNTLQLKALSKEVLQSNSLIEASIDQKTTELKSVPFGLAINISNNKRYLKFALIPVLAIAFLLLASPRLITDPTQRLIRYNDHFEKEFPFSLSVLNEKLEAIQNQDFLLDVLVDGEEIPDEIFLIVNNSRYKLNKKDKRLFSYTFNNLQNDLEFQLQAMDYQSGEFSLKVLPKPLILDFEIALNYPDYTGLSDKLISNNGDLIVPIGTKADWKFYTRNTEEVSIGFGKDINGNLLSPSSNTFSYHTSLFNDSFYYITTSNQYLEAFDTISYRIDIIPDLFPSIVVEEFKDSIYVSRLYFQGTIRDDYGFNKLTFNYILSNENVEVDNKGITDIFLAYNNIQQFFYDFNLNEGFNKPGNVLQYYFEIWDNDGVNGSKSTKSQLMTFKVPTLSELQKESEDDNEQIKEELEDALKETKEINKELEKISKDLIDKPELSWEEKQKLQELINQQMELKKKMDDIKNRNEKKNNKENQFNQVSEEILEKQKQLEDLFNKLAENDEFKKLFDELKELLEDTDKDKVNELLEELKLSNEDLEKMLDRDLALFKQLEFDDKLNKTIEKLEKLSEKQKDLSEQTKTKEKSIEESKKEQTKIEEEFEDIKKDLDDLEKKNEELEHPNDFDKMDEKQNEIEKDMEESAEALEKNKNKKASDSQNNAGQKMKEMSQQLAEMQDSMSQEGMGEDMESLREVLENLIQLSFDQEEMVDEISAINLNDPRYNDLALGQKNIKDELKAVEDSLFALSKRQAMIEPFISKEIAEINDNLNRSIDFLNNRNTRASATRGQYVMTSINNLALMLSETLNQMMQSMMQQQSSCSSEGQSGKPKLGAGKASMKTMRQLQQQLNQQIEALKKGKQKGKNKDGSSPGNNPGQKSMNEQLARMAAAQEALRSKLREYSEQLDKEGQFGSSKEIKRIMEDMETTEEDLVNKKISQQTLLRQNSILTRLLKSEKAEIEREMKQEREAKEAKETNMRNPTELLQYKKVKLNHVELLKTIPPTMKPYYKSKINHYFYNYEELLEK